MCSEHGFIRGCLESEGDLRRVIDVVGGFFGDLHSVFDEELLEQFEIFHGVNDFRADILRDVHAVTDE